MLDHEFPVVFLLLTVWAQGITTDIVAMLDTMMVRMPWLFVGWMCCIGGAIGSFLNVVIYRMPAGISLSYPPSRCPNCETPIRVQDNIPVLSWIVLKGKCRTCRVPIAIRYPFVELLTAAMFTLLALSFSLNSHSSANTLVRFGQFVFCANSLACVLAMALIDFDGHAIPRKLLIYAGMTILLPPLLWGLRNEVLLALALTVLALSALARFMQLSPNIIWLGSISSPFLGAWLIPVGICVVLADRMGGNRSGRKQSGSLANSTIYAPASWLSLSVFIAILMRAHFGNLPL